MNNFTPAQQRIVNLLREAALAGERLDIASIARRLKVQPNTVRSHLRTIYTKIQVRDRAGLVAYLLRQGENKRRDWRHIYHGREEQR